MSLAFDHAIDGGEKANAHPLQKLGLERKLEQNLRAELKHRVPAIDRLRFAELFPDCGFSPPNGVTVLEIVVDESRVMDHLDRATERDRIDG